MLDRGGRRRLYAWLLLVPWFSSAQVHAELYAERLTAANLAERRVGGVDATGGLGDWALGNGTICAVISAADHASEVSRHGGALIDLGHCGSANDQFSVFQQLLNLGRSNAPPVVHIEAQQDGSEARIIVIAEKGGVRLQSTYAVDLVDATRLRVESRLQRFEKGERVSAVGHLIVHAHGTLRPFTLASGKTKRPSGFRHPEVNLRSVRSIVSSMRVADVHVLVGDERIEPEVSYGLQLESVRRLRANGIVRHLPFAMVASDQLTAFSFFARPFWIGGPKSIGMFKLGQSRLMNLKIGDEMVVEQSIRVGDRADVASVTDQLYPQAFRVEGLSNEPAARIHVHDAEGHAVTQVRPAADGSYQMRLPDGEYVLHAVAPGRRELELRFTVAGGDQDLSPLMFPRPSRVLLPESNAALRLVFVGLGADEDPRLGDGLLGLAFGDEQPKAVRPTNHVALGGIPGDPASVVVAPGRYRVLATRGPEFEVTEQHLVVEPESEVRLEIDTPRRAFETPGWIAADLHVHSAVSFDSSLPIDDRLRGFLAEGGEVLVATEHNRVFDISTRIRRLGIADRLAALIGVELISLEPSDDVPFTSGHASVFPLALVPGEPRGGAPSSHDRRLRDVVAEAREREGRPIVQLNHPRSVSRKRRLANLFTHLSVVGKPFDPTRPLDRKPNRVLEEVDPVTGVRDLDFDALELLNGSRTSSYRLVRADWFSLMLQGVFRTATAGSDSHSPSEIPAQPRSYVRLVDDRVSDFDERAFLQAIREGSVIGTTGPFVEAQLDQATIGSLFIGNAGLLSVRVRAASWIPVSVLRVFVNGRVVSERPISRDEPVKLPLEFDTDSFVTLEVEAPADDLFLAIVPGYKPFAFTNPIFVDADGDGRWTGPGWPAKLPAAISAPLRVAPQDLE